MTFAQTLTDFADSTGIDRPDVAPLARMEAAWEDAINAALARDDAAYAKAMARFRVMDDLKKECARDFGTVLDSLWKGRKDA